MKKEKKKKARKRSTRTRIIKRMVKIWEIINVQKIRIWKREFVKEAVEKPLLTPRNEANKWRKDVKERSSRRSRYIV